MAMTPREAEAKIVEIRMAEFKLARRGLALPPELVELREKCARIAGRSGPESVAEILRANPPSGTPAGKERA